MIDSRLLHAELCCRRGKFLKALATYDRILEWYPNEPIPRKLRGNLFLRLGRAEAAERDYLIAAAVRDDDNRVDESAALNVGCLYFWHKRYDLAEKQFDLVLAQSPLEFKALCNRAHACLKRGNFRQTLADYRQMQQLYPGSVSQEMLTALEQDPESVSRFIGDKNMLFAREHPWEEWMRTPSRYCRKPFASSEEAPSEHGAPSESSESGGEE
jgi:tetratricopeptide (TPR) repeat protein